MLVKRYLLVILWAVLAIMQVSARPTDDSVTTISITAIAGMQYDLARFQVKPGARVKLIFSNADDMSHNLLITAPGARLMVIKAAQQLEEKGPLLGYIPKTPQVLWAVPVISPNQTKAITFTAPQKPGVYPYVCTYPGHGYIMYGAMYVANSNNLPDIKTDDNIPEARRVENINAMAASVTGKPTAHANHTTEKPAAAHPYTPVAPYLYRVFMDDASPAAIAVSLPQDISYCWDAGTCRLRYAWRGGFVDNSALWKGHADAVAKVVGTVFYRDNATYPFRIGKVGEVPEVEYKGYRLINRYPEFHYSLNGTEVYELIQPKADGNGLIRTFRLPNAVKTIWFDPGVTDGAVKFDASQGKWENGKLKLSAKEAQEFTLTMTHYALVFNNKKKK